MVSQSFSRPLWKEGMFLAPQHMQQAENYRDAVGTILAHAAPPFPWGIKAMEVDVNLLSAFQFTVQRLECITPSEEVISFPGNIEIPSRSFEGVLTDPQQKVKVYLGIPDYARNGPNLLEEQTAATEGGKFRYRAQDLELTDENTGVLERTIQVKQIRGRLFFDGEDMQGFQLLPLARLKPAPNMEGAVFDEEYVPPVMQVSAWPPLHKSIEGIAARLAVVQSNLVRSLGNKSVAEWCGSSRGVELVLKIQAVNQAYFVMQQVSRTGTMGPFEAYSEILRSIGLFWIFKGEEQLNKAPLYDHLQLGSCFGSAIAILQKLCAIIDAQGHISRQFVQNRGRAEVDLEEDWLTGARKLYLCVHGAGDYAQVMKLMSGVRVSAPSHFERVLQRRIQAVQLQWLRRPPSSLPATEGSVYAEIMQTGRFWPGVVTEMALAVGSSEKMNYRLELFVE